METEEQMIERVYRSMFGDIPIPEDALELVKKTYREYMADLEKERAA
jgi:C4-type Zn-finger protein